MERKSPAAEKVDVLFVTMPFCDEYMPCLTLALFKSVLARAGIKSRVQHEFLYFASRFGREKYRSLMQVCTIGYGHDYFACEAVFADAAHGQPPFAPLTSISSGCGKSMCRTRRLPGISSRTRWKSWT